MMKIESWKKKLGLWYWTKFNKYIPEPVYWIYTSIDIEMIIVTYLFLVIGIPTYLSSSGHISLSICVALIGLMIAHILRHGVWKRRKEDMKREVKEELEEEFPRI